MSIAPFAIAEVAPLRGGLLGLCPMPGRLADLAGDLAEITAWQPRHVVTLNISEELAAHGTQGLGNWLTAQRIHHHAFPIGDFGVPDATSSDWDSLSCQLHGALDAGDRVLVHCMAGCGRSGMIVLRLMVERGEAPDIALTRLRSVRPCAVETGSQMAWARAGYHQPALRPK